MKPKIATGTGVMFPLCASQAGPPERYLGIAYAMLPGVRVLAEASPLPALPLAMVSAHALECGLKAYLSRDGDDTLLKKKEVRHNLNELWSLAFSQGLNIESPPPRWVDCLSQLHNKPYYLRYSTGIDGMTTPAPEPMTTELAAIIKQVREQLLS